MYKYKYKYFYAKINDNGTLKNTLLIKNNKHPK